jgi:hypothetical protein
MDKADAVLAVLVLVVLRAADYRTQAVVASATKLDAGRKTL